MFILMAFILLLPLITVPLMQRFSTQTKTSIYTHLHSVFILTAMLGKWVMMFPIHMLQQLAIGFIVFSIGYSISQIGKWRIFQKIMFGLMLLSSVWILGLMIVLS
ncbi:hypothetical protein [Moraxella sp. ZY210820]|uniref:hypothetical protein n=1 Tax=unclassified Moraxella TaxID=2685852 RepID=UPI002730CA63|nr:hypothetical protein [Moraxella sp. ZY210820]WLF83514.1 hypothetical protein LU301_09640 [Moraxella sp. ZY210820]